jgi:hypothetical protein
LYKVEQCQPCTTGKYCPSVAQQSDAGNCDAGHYCITSATDNADNTLHTSAGSGSDISGLCPKFNFCTAGVGMGLPIKPGYFVESTGQTAAPADISANKQVAGSYSYTVLGFYETVPTMVNGLCLEGYWCPEGQTWPYSVD